MSDIIIFYDIPSISGKGWSPNTWKTRLALKFKGLPYKTVWVEYPNIQSLSKEIGAAPTTVDIDGSPKYTLPAIYDPKTKRAISDSQDIAEYLDATYPETPVLFPSGTLALQFAFQEAFTLIGLGSVFPPMIQDTMNILNEESKNFYRRTREAAFRKKVEEICPLGPIRDEAWRKAREGLTMTAGWLQKRRGPYIMGETISYADLHVVAWLLWVRQVKGSESEEWNRIITWDNGLWGGYIAQFGKYIRPDA
ncbi:hypothetical protein NEOLEDRAFT_1176878 [Neolentinus lepideus HHB14362 ss-1]|uniref:GST N-terminal domain-containing protein n=1 Tax=Neolentinus lepideus HHB14362 ss-1 TaxID=1314782 RepID=A0A165U102_9AGAM|nr:hypothetical protein NEOLEDRAFT_1176878 [Neolentinus lepideus HHB14362 ss-1]